MKTTLKTSRKQLSKNIKLCVALKYENVLIYGAGKFVPFIKEKIGVLANSWVFYEPYVAELSVMPKEKFNVVVLDNVLNVIQDDYELMDTLLTAWLKVDASGCLLINIYEGNGKGTHTFNATQNQRNEKIINYVKFINTLETLLGAKVTNMRGGYHLSRV